MPEKLSDKTVFSLAEVARSIQKTIAERYKSIYWVKAEMNKLNHYSHSGHCYPELVEKKDGRIVAEMRSILWSGDFQRINQRFIDVINEPLKNGISILFQATISYDPLYGLTLRILDIDPAYSLGELAREKKESIDRLKKEGIFFANKGLPFPVVPKRLAVISVETSKGYSDFLKILHSNPWGYRFEETLFPAILQGDKSIPAIINQLARIADQKADYDAVAIIRGGGGDVGLSSYNNYSLAAAIARFPLPILTGIGHSTNETVSEMTAYKNAITPTELADFLIQQFHNYATPVHRAKETIVLNITQRLMRERKTLNECGRYFRLNSVHLLGQHRKTLEYCRMQLKLMTNGLLKQRQQEVRLVQHTAASISLYAIKNSKGDLTAIERTIKLLDPQRVLNRGYSITRVNGLVIKNINEIQNGDIINTTLATGNITSTVNKKTLENE